jgi:hypothetical protein
MSEVKKKKKRNKKKPDAIAEKNDKKNSLENSEK